MRCVISRDVLWSDVPLDPNKPPPYSVAVVNESFVKHYFGEANPIGRHIGFGGDPGTPTPIEIIGVVRDSKHTGVRDEIPRQVFFAYLQNNFAGSAAVYVRSTQDPAAALARRGGRCRSWIRASLCTTCVRSSGRSSVHCSMNV